MNNSKVIVTSKERRVITKLLAVTVSKENRAVKSKWSVNESLRQFVTHDAEFYPKYICFV